jgi:hypothetical protein
VRRSCENCAKKWYWDGVAWGDGCLDYTLRVDRDGDDPEIVAAECPVYEPEEPSEDDRVPSSTAGDYGPSNPWDAPGMSVHDFI